MRTLVLATFGVLTACSSKGPGATDATMGSDPDAQAPVSPNGNPDGACQDPLPPNAKAADVSHPTAVIGTGTPASCTFAALDAAVKAGGVITFDCGPSPVSIAITAPMKLPIDKDTVIDGGGTITLDGQNTSSILRFEGTNFMVNEHRLTVQHIAFVNGKIAGSMPIPVAPAPCSQGFNDGEGGAIFMRDGNLTVFDARFEGNNAAPLGPDVGGGAIRMLGSKHGVLVVGSTFRNNHASNGAAIGCLFSELDVYNSLVEGNSATGHDANNDDASKCSVINNGQHEIGSGGNGGALYSDGASTTANPVNVVLCGNKITNNAAGQNAFGGGLFFTSNNFGGTISITDTVMTGNTGGHWTNVQEGMVTNAGTAVGTNAKSIAIKRSTLQGVP